MHPDSTAPTSRQAYRPPLGIPKGRENRRFGAIVSVLVHVLILLLLIAPFVAHGPIVEILQGAGGKGPAGGGGGGRGGTGGQTRRETEHLDFVSVAPAPKPKAPAVQPPKPKRLPVPPPPVVKKPPPTAEVITVVPTTAAPAAKPLDVASTSGTGGGSGRYPPQPIEVFLPPYPIPGDVKGFHLVAEFDVDSTGRVLSMDFTPTPDRGYNRRLGDVFRSFKFRPGTMPDGTPLRMKAQIVVDLY
ncbi:MAG: hypothetical protein B7Z72_00525 [Gemmatimonadetes bacterium 21-71-4]|nr:MAG: hypothetical protein B7Z72_00525 [Gemmatimonadetes bacterium 21-71-4]